MMELNGQAVRMAHGLYNRSWELAEIYRVSTASYSQFFRLAPWSLYEYARRFYSYCAEDYDFPRTFMTDFRDTCDLSITDVLLILIIAFLFTLTRIQLTELIILPSAKWLETPKDLIHRVPESVFKVIVYVSTTLFTFYTVFYTEHYAEWNDPLIIYEKWKPHAAVDGYVYVIYMAELGFYIHSVYGTVYLDSQRKDTYIMLAHHIITITLLVFSYASRHHMEGILVLFCHDICDIFLELWKLNSTLRRRAGGRYYALHDALANVAFVGFASTWYVFRLYWFPLKVLYATTYGPVAFGLAPLMPFYPIYAVLLNLLLCMNLYWFSLVIIGLVNFALGNLTEIDDTREIDPSETSSDSSQIKMNEDSSKRNSALPSEERRVAAKKNGWISNGSVHQKAS